MPITILRPPVAFNRLGLSKSVAYDRISKGLLPSMVKLGSDARAAGLPDFEVEAIARAYISGASDTQMRALVDRLHQARTRLIEVEVVA